MKQSDTSKTSCTNTVNTVCLMYICVGVCERRCAYRVCVCVYVCVCA